jgi:N-acetylmuramoyl-L-alanine amidase
MTNDYILYALKVMLFQGISYGVYWTLFRKSNHFSLNRAYLLCTFVLGFLAPTIMLPASALPIDSFIPDVNITTGTFSEIATRAVATSSAHDTQQSFIVLHIIYSAGVLILLLRSALSVLSIGRIRRRGVEHPTAIPKVITIKEAMSFTFINTILLHECADPAVFLHEKGHVTGKHWVDLIFMEIVCIVWWFNPFAWLFRKSLKQQHEYLADGYVLKHGVSPIAYLQCILNSISHQEPIGPVHKFNSHSLKQRISMITNARTSRYSKAFYIAIIPLIALLLFSFSGKKERQGLIDTEKVFVIDAAHGGADAGSSSASGVSEKAVALNLARLVQDAGKKKGLNILLTRTTDQQISLQERLDVCASAKADVFLSLHLGSEKAGEKGGGVYVSEASKNYTGSKRIAAVLGEALNDIRGFRNPQVRNSDAFVLKNNSAASAILEIACLSDDEDAKFISDPANQQKIASRIVSALMKY